eukprot:1195915-Prorocentrum_minimum.AAC.9
MPTALQCDTAHQTCSSERVRYAACAPGPYPNEPCLRPWLRVSIVNLIEVGSAQRRRRLRSRRHSAAVRRGSE